MRFRPPRSRSAPRVGAIAPQPRDGSIVDLRLAFEALLVHEGADPREAARRASLAVPATMERLVAMGPPALETARRALTFAAAPGDRAQPGGAPFVHDPSEVRLLAPLARPNSLRDFVGFEDHARAGAARRGEELARAWHQRPFYYKGNHRSIAGPGDDVRRPRYTAELDFEMEVACVVGRTGRDLTEQEAAGSIFGFTIMNDWSARDVQRLEMAARLGPAKSKDFATSLGPCLVTAGAIGPHPDLRMAARVNGEVVCEARLGSAYWTFPKMIELVSQEEDVWPTDLIGSGTPFGCCLLDQGRPYLVPGDEVELEVEAIGVLRNRVAQSPPSSPMPAAQEVS